MLVTLLGKGYKEQIIPSATVHPTVYKRSTKSLQNATHLGTWTLDSELACGNGEQGLPHCSPFLAS